MNFPVFSQLAALRAIAQTDEIQVYDATINAPGQFSLELHKQLHPIGRKQPDFEGGITPNQEASAERGELPKAAWQVAQGCPV